MKKYFVLDTNVLLQSPQALMAFEDNNVILPECVLEELDNLKRDRDPEVRYNVRETSRILDKLREEQGDLYEGVDLPNGGTLRVELNHVDKVELPRSWESAKVDNRILGIAKNLQKEGFHAVVVSKDTFLRIKSDVIGVPAQDYRREQVIQTYKGWEEIIIRDEEVDKLYMNKKLPWESELPNQFYLIRSNIDPQKTALAKSNNEEITLLEDSEPSFYSFKLDMQQRFAREALRDPNIPLVTIMGATGSGKTMLALGVGLEKIMGADIEYRRMLICRPNVGMGEDIGFLPGGEKEKIAPFMRPIYDNLEQLVDSDPDRYKNEQELNGKVNYLFDSRKIVTEAIAYLQGRSIVNQFILIDEAQNLTPKQVKGIVTRAGEGTKIVLVGDPGQINSPFLDERTNGLSWAVEKMRGSSQHAHITLDKTRRSLLAEDAGIRMN